MYSIFTAACGFAQTVTQLAIFRVLLGLGMGGEWATGAALVSESFPARHRGKALAFVQSSWAIGYGFAALVNLIVMPIWGWRGVFFVGVLPALFTMWIRRNVEEPKIWRTAPRPSAAASACCSRPAIAQGHRLRHADERLHAVRLVGPEQLGAGLSRARPGSAAASACRPR